jgi:hypothetical protein
VNTEQQIFHALGENPPHPQTVGEGSFADLTLHMFRVEKSLGEKEFGAHGDGYLDARILGHKATRTPPSTPP